MRKPISSMYTSILMISRIRANPSIERTATGMGAHQNQPSINLSRLVP